MVIRISDKNEKSSTQEKQEQRKSGKLYKKKNMKIRSQEVRKSPRMV
jgi:hypothetical protein